MKIATLYKSGNSLVFGVPADLIDKLVWEKNDKLVLQYVQENNSLRVRALKDSMYKGGADDAEKEK